MSGGYYDYLCMRQLDEFVTHELGMLRRMATDILRNETKDTQRAGDDTLAIIKQIDEFKKKLEPKIEALRPVWRAQEWYMSADIGLDQLQATLREYADAHRM